MCRALSYCFLKYNVFVVKIQVRSTKTYGPQLWTTIWLIRVIRFFRVLSWKQLNKLWGWPHFTKKMNTKKMRPLKNRGDCFPWTGVWKVFRTHQKFTMLIWARITVYKMTTYLAKLTCNQYLNSWRAAARIYLKSWGFSIPMTERKTIKHVDNSYIFAVFPQAYSLGDCCKNLISHLKAAFPQVCEFFCYLFFW